MDTRSLTMSAFPFQNHCHALTPSQVKYWAIGNEMWGAWQIGQMTKEDYAKEAYQWAKALKLADPTIELILCGCEGISAWDYHVLKECITYNVQALGNNGCLIEMHSIHLYTASNDHLQNAVGMSPPSIVWIDSIDLAFQLLVLPKGRSSLQER